MLVGGLLLATASGCLAVAGGAAAGAAGYAYYRGNKTEIFNTDFATVWSATHEALYDLGMPVLKESHDAISGTIETVTGAKDSVRIQFEQITPKFPNDWPQTEVSIRVATFGDSEVSARIFQEIINRILSREASRIPPQPPPASAAWAPAHSAP